MYLLLLILITVKVYARINIFKGQNTFYCWYKLFIYLFIYLFLFKVGLHVVKNFLTNNNDKINKQTIKFEKPLPHLV